MDKAPIIPRKPKIEAVNGSGTTNGAAGTNGVQAPEPATKTLKRPHPNDDEVALEPKRVKRAQPEADDGDVVIIEDEGAILIDD